MNSEFTLDPKQKNTEYFYGINNINKVEGFGIVFECKFDEELGIGLESEIEKVKFLTNTIPCHGKLLQVIHIK